MGSTISIDFDASTQLLGQMHYLIDVGKRQHHGAIQSITEQVNTAFAHLPTIHSMMDVLIDHMQIRPEDLRVFFEEDWLPAMEEFVERAHTDEVQLSQALPPNL